MITMSDFVCLVCDATLDASSCTNVFYSFLPRSGEPLVNFLSRVLRVAVSDLRGSYVCSQCSNLFEMLEQAQRTVANICCEIFKAYRGNARLKNEKERSTGDEAAPPDRPFTQQQQQQQPGPDIPEGDWLKEAPGLSSVTAGIQEKIAKVQAEEQRPDSVITGMNEQLGKTGNRAESVFPEDKSETRVIPETVSFGWNGIEDNITEDITKEMTDISNGLLPVEEREVNRIARLKSGKLSKGSNGKALKYSCPTCGKKWRTSAELKTHIKTHSTLKPYMCEKCGQAYKHKHALEIHVGMHNGINPFKCSFCNKCFTQKGALMRHLPMHTGERPYQCELCGKRFIHHTSYNMHRLSHTGKKSYKCHVCELSLLSTSHLKRHMRVHTGEKPYNCAICGKRFAERYNLLVHQKIHDPSETKPRKMEKPRHKCGPCNLTFERKQSLDDHSNFHPEGNTEIEGKEFPVQSENLLGESWPQINRSKLDVIDGQTKFMLLQNPLTQIHDNSLTVAFANDKILENGNYNASLQVIIQSSDASVLGNHIALDNTQI